MLPLKPSSLLDEKDWDVFLCRLREERPLFTVYLTTCTVTLSWDGVLSLVYPREAMLIRQQVDVAMPELAARINEHFGERIVQVNVQQVV